MNKLERESYAKNAGLILGDHLDSNDYCVDGTLRVVKDGKERVGAWVQAWIYVREKEIDHN